MRILSRSLSQHTRMKMRMAPFSIRCFATPVNVSLNDGPDLFLTRGVGSLATSDESLIDYDNFCLQIRLYT